MEKKNAKLKSPEVVQLIYEHILLLNADLNTLIYVFT